MRLVTSCPACNTLFHVRQEQLSLHQAEVRCGQCREVFSLAPRLYAVLQPQTLLPEAQAPVFPAVNPVPPPAENTAEELADNAAPENPGYSEPLLTALPPEAPAEEAPAEEAPVEEVPVEEVPVEEVPVEEVPVEEVPVEEVPVEEVPVEEVSVEEVSVEEVPHEQTPLTESPSGDSPDDLPPPASEVSAPEADHGHVETEHSSTYAADMQRQRTETLEVLLQPPRPQAEPEPIMETSFLDDRERLHTPLLPRWLAIILAILLSLGILAQSTYIFRTELASHWPASKPWLVSACTWLGCTVPLARHAELLALDDSDLQENLEHPEVIQLSTTLINNAAYTQAYPLLELTLTDDEDQPRLRRIFTPKEYLRAEADIEAGLPANEEIQIKLSLSTSDVAVSGYRVFVTY